MSTPPDPEREPYPDDFWDDDDDTDFYDDEDDFDEDFTEGMENEVDEEGA